MGYSPRTSRKKNTMCPSRDNSGRCPWMTIRSKQWYTKTSSFPNRERNVSIGRLLVLLLLQQDLRSDGRWNQIHCLATKSTPWDFQGRSPWLYLDLERGPVPSLALGRVPPEAARIQRV